MKLAAFLLCFWMFALEARSLETKLASIASDTTTDITVFYIETHDNGAAQAMRYVTTAESGRIKEDIHSRLEEVLREGVVVKVMDGREIIRLFLQKFDPLTGGTIRLRYLANGVTNSFGNTYIKLAKKDGKFVLIDDGGEVANYLYIWGNWSQILRRWIGVSSIEANAQPIRK